MKTSLAVLLGASSLFAATASHAVEFTGGSVKLSYSRFVDEDAGQTLSNTSFDSSFEVGFTKSFAAQLDLGVNGFGASNLDGDNTVLHGIYHASESLSLGAFYGQDGLESASTNYFGGEAGYEIGAFEAEAYFLSDNESDRSFDIFGLSGEWAFADQLAMTASYTGSDFGNNTDLSRIAVGVSYAVADSVNLTAEFGTADIEASGTNVSENFISLGAEFTFGAERGSTFGKRGVLHLFPGL